MPDLVDVRLDSVFALYDELAAVLDGAQLRQSLPVPSNPIGLQLWCVVGGRETWARAMESGRWGPFSCSIQGFAEAHDPVVVRRALAESAGQLRAAVTSHPADDVRAGLKLDLLEHETQHLGQLLRYLLGLGIEPPAGWRARFRL